MPIPSIVHAVLPPRADATKLNGVSPASADAFFSANPERLWKRHGLGVSRSYMNSLRRMTEDSGGSYDSVRSVFDAAPLPPLTTPSAQVPIQFLQAWIAGVVYIITQARKADTLLGTNVIGDWLDSEIVLKVLERVKGAEIYSDHTNIPLASFNVNLVRRAIVRFELGFEVGVLEEGMQAKYNINAAYEKRQAVALNLEIARNFTSFFGFDRPALSTYGETYGLLNDPNLLPYTTVPAGAGGSTLWVDKSFEDIVNDILLASSVLIEQSGATINPRTDRTVLAIPSQLVPQLYTPNAIASKSIIEYLTSMFPLLRIEDAPEFFEANGGESVFYFYSETVKDSGTDDLATMTQLIPVKFQSIGIERKAKGYVEDYTNATAGVLVKRPIGVARFTGI